MGKSQGNTGKSGRGHWRLTSLAWNAQTSLLTSRCSRSRLSFSSSEAFIACVAFRVLGGKTLNPKLYNRKCRL